MNILSLIQDQLSPQTIHQVSNVLGESPESTTSALGTAFPALLGSLVGKANSGTGGITEIFNLVRLGPSGGGWSESLSNILPGTKNAGATQSASQSLLGSLFGSKLSAVTE